MYTPLLKLIIKICRPANSTAYSGCAAYVFLAILPYSRVISQVSDPLGEAYEMRRLSQEAVIHHESEM